MNTEIVPPIKRRRGRPRKKNSNVTAINKFPTFTPQTSYKRKALETTSPDIEIISLNGLDPKKPRPDDSDQPKRLQPPRRARFTESYGGTADVVLVSASESESESDSDCSPIPSPVAKVRTREEQEAHEANIQVLRKALGDEEMKLVLLRKLRESQRGKRGEANGSPLPTALVGGAQRQPAPKGGVQIQPLPSKQLITNNKYLAHKRDIKPDVISNNNSSSLLKTSSSSQFKPIQSSFKPHQQPYNKPIKQESSTVSSSSVEQLNSNHLNQYPLLKNLSNQITITAVPPPTSSSNGSSRHQQQQQQQQQQQLQDEKNDAETLQQRQAAAKLALRKQLEKTLLQIPLPKPPPLKINFYPTYNSMEYLCLLGLDFVVDFLTRSKRQSSDQKDPLRCAQCATDFTCAWKWKEVDRDGRKVFDVFCEACITSNVRKALKAQHTNNLKSAFLKALQQEKEIDRLTIHTMPKSSSSSHRDTPKSSRDMPKSSSSQRDIPKSSQSVRDTLKSNRHHARQHAESSSAGRQPSPAHQGSSSAFSIPKQGMAMPYIPKAQGNINHAALAQLSKLSPQYQSLLQAQAQQLLAAGVPLHPGVLSLSPFMTPHHGSQRKGEGGRSNRHYRSDRVQSPNIPHSSSSWKA